MFDPVIIEECRSGNRESFRRLVEATSPFIYSVAFRMLGDEENARDIVQETMLTVWEKISKIRSAEAYKTWVYRIVMNRCYDKLRHQKSNPEVRGDERTWTLISNTIADGTVSKFENDEISSVIKVLTCNLSPKQKSVFILSDIEELSNDEVSEITGMSKTSVKSNLYFARKNIASMLEKYVR